MKMHGSWKLKNYRNPIDSGYFTRSVNFWSTFVVRCVQYAHVCSTSSEFSKHGPNKVVLSRVLSLPRALGVRIDASAPEVASWIRSGNYFNLPRWWQI